MQALATVAARARSTFGLALGMSIALVLLPIAALVVILSSLFGRCTFGQGSPLQADGDDRTVTAMTIKSTTIFRPE
jgi:hypothetical protein